MRINFGPKSWLHPMPVLIVASYDENGVPNAMIAAWGGIYTDNTIGICLTEDHRTTKNILQTKVFTVSPATAEHIAECDYVGIVSGNNEPNKFAKSGFNHIRSDNLNAPIIKELPMCLECELLNYDYESNYLTAKIVNINADESILTDGHIDIKKLRPITYDPISHNYYEIGNVVGKAFCDGKVLKSKSID